MVTKLDTSRLSSITLQNARFSARGKVWDESGRGFRGSGTNNQRQTPCRALVGSRGLTLSRGRGNAHPEALLIRTCPQSIACIQIWASKRQTCYLMELHSLYWRSNNTFLVSWRYGRKHEHWKHLQTRTIHLKDDKESWKDRLVIFFTCRRSVRKANNCDPKLEECGLGRSFQNLCHSFSQYGPPIRQTTYIFSHIVNQGKIIQKASRISLLYVESCSAQRKWWTDKSTGGGLPAGTSLWGTLRAFSFYYKIFCFVVCFFT